MRGGGGGGLSRNWLLAMAVPLCTALGWLYVFLGTRAVDVRL